MWGKIDEQSVDCRKQALLPSLASAAGGSSRIRVKKDGVIALLILDLEKKNHQKKELDAHGHPSRLISDYRKAKLLSFEIVAPKNEPEDMSKSPVY